MEAQERTEIVVALTEQLQEAEEFAGELVVLNVRDQAFGAARCREHAQIHRLVAPLEGIQVQDAA